MDQEGAKLAPQPQTPNPWLTMWTHPRATMRRIVDSNPTQDVVGLAVIGGFGTALWWATGLHLGNSMSLSAIGVWSVVVGAINGFIWVYGVGALVRWTGTWIGGQASFAQVRAALAWAQVPYIWAILLWIPRLVLVGKGVFTPATPRMTTYPVWVRLLLATTYIADVAIMMWGAVVWLRCVGEVHQFSAWKALGSYLLTVAASAAIVVLVASILALIVTAL